MPMLRGPADPISLRQVLRDSTKAEHDRLDRAVDGLDFVDLVDYGRFLSFQMAARRPVEAWLAEAAPGKRPPAQCDLIAADLASLGIDPAIADAPFSPPDDGDVIGACWAIAGSSLGNRAIHRALTKAAPQDPPPTRFLGDSRMTEYWQELKPALEAPVEDDRSALATASAAAVFRAFQSAADEWLRKTGAVL